MGSFQSDVLDPDGHDHHLDLRQSLALVFARGSVEDTTLTTLGLVECHPLTHECTDLSWSTVVDRRVVCQRPLGVTHPPLTGLRITHTVIHERRQ